MSEIAKLTARMTELSAQVAELEKEANALEQLAREKRAARAQAKKEMAELTTVLQHERVIDSVAQSVDAAAKAKKEAEASAAENARITAELQAKNKEADELLAKLKAQAEKAE